MFCTKCGKEISNESRFCPYCGQSTSVDYQGDSLNSNTTGEKSRIASGILNILLPFGIGRLYAGYIGIGIAQLLLVFLGVGTIWSIIDGILILTGMPSVDGSGKRRVD